MFGFVAGFPRQRDDSFRAQSTGGHFGIVHAAEVPSSPDLLEPSEDGLAWTPSLDIIRLSLWLLSPSLALTAPKFRVPLLITVQSYPLNQGCLSATGRSESSVNAEPR